MEVATKQYVDNNAGGGSSSFDLSDRIAKGVDENGNAVNGAVIEGLIEELVIQNNNYTIGPNEASGEYSHAEGSGTAASGYSSHAEGDSTVAMGNYSHVEGAGTEASGESSHAEGQGTIASGYYAHAEGYGTIANHKSQHVFGEWNIEDSSNNTSNNKGNYIEIVGNGTNSNSRLNARTLDWNGNEKLAGSLTLGMGTADEVTITAAQLKELLGTIIK